MFWTAKPKIKHESALYLASVQSLLTCIRAVPVETSALWVVGHNPGLAELATLLAGSTASQHGLSRKFPTASRAVFALEEASWSDIGKQSLRLTAFLRVSG